MDEIRNYLVKLADAAGITTNTEWAQLAGIDVAVMEKFLDGRDIPLSAFLALSAATESFVLPVPNTRKDETIMLLEAEGIYAEGASDPFDRYRSM